jgi:hypothetical protein
VEIRRVLIRKTDKVKFCIIPKLSKINAGDLVLVTNNLKLIEQFQNEEKGGNHGKENS